jgi:very-short-patch-repair endonuclease
MTSPLQHLALDEKQTDYTESNSETAERLIGLLQYAKALNEADLKIILDAGGLKEGFFTEADLHAYENVSFDPESTEIHVPSTGSDSSIAPEGLPWLVIKRIPETTPPAPPEITLPFLQGVRIDSLSLPPQLKPLSSVRLSPEEGSDLVEAGLAEVEDVRIPQGQTLSNLAYVDALLRLERFTEVRGAFTDYLRDQWKPWLEMELSRKKGRDLYKKFYEIRQRVNQQSEAWELVLGLGFCLQQTEKGLLRSPLIEHPLDIWLHDGGGYHLHVLLKGASSAVNIQPFQHLGFSGTADLVVRLKALLEEAEEILLPFNRALHERIAQTATAVLDPNAAYEASEGGLPVAVRTLVCTDTWALYIRPKSARPFAENIEALIAQIQKTPDEDLPPAGRCFAEPPKNTRDASENGLDLNRTTFSSSDWDSVSSLSIPQQSSQEQTFFPLAHNDEQAAIIQLLQKSEAVCVQGPPGTGKSHTIANIIAHYMATGRRVLVTARTAHALTAVRTKLPEDLRKLTVAVLGNDTDSKQQVEDAITVITNQAQSLDRKTAEQEVLRLHKAVDGMKEEVSRIDTALLEHARRQMSKVPHRGELLLPADIVRHVVENASAYAWFPDVLGIEESFDPRFGDNEIARLRELRRDLGDAIVYATEELPEGLAALPDVPAIKAAHEQIRSAASIERLLQGGELPEPSEVTADFKNRMNWLAEQLELAATIRHDLEKVESLRTVARSWLHGTLSDEARIALQTLFQEICEWFDATEAHLVRSIHLGEVDLHDPDMIQALSAAAAGKKPFGLSSLFKGEAKTRFATIKIRGLAPASEQDWKYISDFATHQRNLRPLINHWNAAALQFDLPALPEDFNVAVAALKKMRPLLNFTNLSPEIWRKVVSEVKTLFPWGIDHPAVPTLGKDFDLVLEATQRWRNHAELKAAKAVPQHLLQLSHKGTGPVFEELSAFAARLGNNEEPETVGETWRGLRRRLIELADKKALLDDVRVLTKRIEENGASKWSNALRTHPATEQQDQLLPGSWRLAWDHARALGFVQSLPSRDEILKLAAKREQLEQDIRARFQELILLRTYLGIKKNLTERTASALARYTTALRKVGKNIMGKRSVVHWRTAQDALGECYDAIPCWIMPESRIAEQIPAKLGVFDLVVVDESSQSDITTLPVILRGKQLLVVGDDRQVSPETVGTEEAKLTALRDQYLYTHPYRDSFHPQNSLYDLVGMMIPGQRLMLREHFRCVEPIIRFCSNNFYSEPLIPLRLPDADKRLDPPLIDILVKDGAKTDGNINYEEADCIVKHIYDIVKDAQCAGRSIGVISLTGAQQAAHIDRRLRDELTVEEFERHDILCGDARHFQGQERDIVFLSMVASPRQCRALTTRGDQQRFNVAVSRARDRLVLVRSVTETDLNPNCLRSLLIQHFKDPMSGVNVEGDLIKLCQSEFERKVFRLLVADGYRVIPQYPVGLRRIDFVVEGENDRRLAIELDGDEFHGPDRYAQDVKRQKDLERVGWHFWRCWASDWEQDSATCYTDLREILTKMGIVPTGSNIGSYVYVRHDVWQKSEDKLDSSQDLLSLLENF